jgi:hypothetical protein
LTDREKGRERVKGERKWKRDEGERGPEGEILKEDEEMEGRRGGGGG